MENKFTEEDVKLLNTLSDRPPPPFRVGDIVIWQPSEREIYEKEIEPWEQSVLLGYRSVKEYLYPEQYWDANDLDDLRFEEYEMHIHGKKEKSFLKSREGQMGQGRWKRRVKRMWRRKIAEYAKSYSTRCNYGQEK